MKLLTVLKSSGRVMGQAAMLTVIQLFGFMAGAQLAGVPSPRVGTTEQATVIPRPPVSELRQGEAAGGARRSALEGQVKPSFQADQARLFGLVALVCLLNSLALVLWIRQSTWTGMRLAAGVFVVFFSCMTLMPQSETWFFLPGSTRIIRVALVMGFCVSTSIAIGTLGVYGRWRTKVPNSSPGRLAGMSRMGFLSRLAVSMVFYVALYLVFGYFIAWQYPELRVLYGGDAGDVRGFWQHVSSPPVLNLVIPLQLARGLAWTLLGVWMIHFSTGNRWELAVAVGLVFAVVMNSQLLLPNPVMSQEIRLTHLTETATSNFLFGWSCVALWTTGRNSAVS